jgi:hypothetical protein
LPHIDRTNATFESPSENSNKGYEWALVCKVASLVLSATERFLDMPESGSGRYETGLETTYLDSAAARLPLLVSHRPSLSKSKNERLNQALLRLYGSPFSPTGIYLSPW